MSLRGRYVIDRIKRAVGHRLALPCPPYGSPTYWDGVYKKLGPRDVYEWGNFTLSADLIEHRYDKSLFQEDPAQYGYIDRSGAGGSSDNDGHPSKMSHIGGSSDLSPKESGPYIQTSFGEAIGVDPSKPGKILLLGCGNSRFGEELLSHSFSGPVISVDISSKLVSNMTERYDGLVKEGSMDIICDDATQLSAFDSESIDAVVDKGLVDAIFCANQYSQIHSIMESTSRVLKPGSVFAMFSFSRPEFLLQHTLVNGDHTANKRMWSDVEVRKLDNILMYRYVKSIAKRGRLGDDDDESKRSSNRDRREQRQNRRLRNRRFGNTTS